MHSQNQEEKYILEYFGDFVGTFADIGANNGTTFSNTRALALKGWTGVLVEPSPKAFEQLKSVYDGHKNFKLYPWAISDRNGKAMLQESGPLCSAADIGLVSTFHQEEVNRFKATVKYEPVEVKTFTWRTAVNRWKQKHFTMISLDIEGHEMKVLPDIDLSQTKVLVIEWNSKPELKTQYEKHLEGFKVIYTSAENLVYAR